METLQQEPENCVGPKSETAGKADSCNGCPNQNICSSGILKQPDPDINEINKRMSKIKHKILVFFWQRRSWKIYFFMSTRAFTTTNGLSSWTIRYRYLWSFHT